MSNNKKTVSFPSISGAKPAKTSPKGNDPKRR